MADPRNTQRLMAEWVQLASRHERFEHIRGYDVRYVQKDIDRESARAEAHAAAALASQYAAA